MKDYVILKSLIVRKDNIIFATKQGISDISMAIDNKNSFTSMQIIGFQNEEERDKAFNKLIVALTGDIE